MKILITGGAGFIGSAVVRLAIARGHHVVNVDALTYAACLDNVASVAEHPNYVFEQVDIRDCAALDGVFAKHTRDAVMHLAINLMLIVKLTDLQILSKPILTAHSTCLRRPVAIGRAKAIPIRSVPPYQHR